MDVHLLSLGRRTSVVDPDFGIWSCVYDAAGRLTDQTDAKGQVTRLADDALGLVLTKTATRTTNGSWQTCFVASVPRGGGTRSCPVSALHVRFRLTCSLSVRKLHFHPVERYGCWFLPSCIGTSEADGIVSMRSGKLGRVLCGNGAIEDGPE
jgi:YD repeat-containing protein